MALVETATSVWSLVTACTAIPARPPGGETQVHSFAVGPGEKPGAWEQLLSSVPPSCTNGSPRLFSTKKLKVSPACTEPMTASVIRVVVSCALTALGGLISHSAL